MKIEDYYIDKDDYDGITVKEKRYLIKDDNGKIIDNANGYGYKTFANAQKAMWYKYGGGKNKIKNIKNEKKDFFIKHKDIEVFLEDFMSYNLKEIYRGEITNHDIFNMIREEFSVDMPERFLN